MYRRSFAVKLFDSLTVALLFRDETTDAIIKLVEYSNQFAAYSHAENKHTLELLDNFARHLFVWRRPYPKLRLTQVSSAHSKHLKM